MAPPQSAFLNGVPELLVLRLLRERDMYGYEIVQAIRDASGDAIGFAEGVIYPLLHSLEREGALTTRRQTVNGRNRVYYSVTPIGAGRLAGLAEQWHELQHTIAGILAEPRHG